MDRRRLEAFASIPQRANLVLYIVFFLFTLIGFRLWHLSVVKHSTYAGEAFRFRKLTIKEPAMRGTIRDRFHIVLATNVIDYRVGISWAPIQEIPRTFFATNKEGKKEKISLRKEYVKALSALLSKELSLDVSRVEDAIHSYALFSSTGPFFLKTGLSEEQYYRLNMLAKDWPGLVLERAPKRVYPKGRLASHIVGYIAPQNREDFEKILLEKAALEDYVKRVERGEDVDLLPGYDSFFAVKERILILERKAYILSDAIGKSGVEAFFEGSLRGLSGKKCFATNAQGEIIRKVAGSKEPVSGKRLILSLSSELQAFCEKLLAQDELLRGSLHEKDEKKYPSVSGGAIVVLDPNSFEVLASASLPDFDPNDFVKNPSAFFDKKTSSKAIQWARGESFARKTWDLELPFYEEKWLTWATFLDVLLSKDSPLRIFLEESTSLKKLNCRKKAWDSLSKAWGIELSNLPDAFEKYQESSLKGEERQAYRELKSYFDLCSSKKEKLLLYDLSSLLFCQEQLVEGVSSKIEHLSLSFLRQASAAKVYFVNALRSESEEAFRLGPFAAWRKEHEVEFLKKKREEERSKKNIAKPFLHHIDKECARQFSEWWKEAEADVLYMLFSGKGKVPLWLHERMKQKFKELVHEERVLQHMKILTQILSSLDEKQGRSFLLALRSYDALTTPLLGVYGNKSTGQDLIRLFFSTFPSTMASFAYMQPHPQGSIFKLAVAYAALQQRLEEVGGDPEKLDPSFFTMTDTTYHQDGKLYVGFDAKGKAIPQLYKGGRVPKSVESEIGELDLVRAIERSSNPYFALLAGDYLKSPERMLAAAKLLGYGEKTGILLPNEAKGRLPSDLEGNKTGVYTTAIGQHTVLATPLQAAVALTALYAGEVNVPKILRMAIGPESSAQHEGKNAYGELLKEVGVSFPLFIADMTETSKKRLFVPPKHLKHILPITNQEQMILAKGMRAVCERVFADKRLRAKLKHTPHLLTALEDEFPCMLGKSSTAQVLENQGLKIGQKPLMYSHVWFGGVFFKEPFQKNTLLFSKPDLTVVVFLRYGSSGKEAAPLAAAVAREWRRIQKKHSS